MLNQVMQEIRAAGGAVRIDDLSRKLSVDRAALQGMIQFLERKGTLRSASTETSVTKCADCPSCRLCSSNTAATT